MEVSFLKTNYQDLINKELKKNNERPNQQIITITLGSFTHFKYLKDENSVKNCLKEVLEVIKLLKINFPVFIKPHVVSDQNIYMKILSNTLNKNIIISQLHPGILTMASKVFISNYFSYTLSTAKFAFEPTIEYTRIQ